MFKYLNSIATLLIVTILLSFLTPLAIGGIYTWHKQNLRFESEWNLFLNHIMQSLEFGVSDAMLNLEPAQAMNVARLVIHDPRILRVKAYSSIYEMTLVDLDKKQLQKVEHYLHKKRVIYHEGEQVGFVEITIDSEVLDKNITRIRYDILRVFTGMFIFGMAMIWPIIYFKILKPAKRLMTQAEILSQEDMNTRFQWEGGDELSRLGRMLEKMRMKLNTSFIRIQKLAVTDELTQMPNRRAFFSEARKALDTSYRYNHPFSLALIDIDHFKSINDSHGHDMGDRVLQGFAGCIMKNMRSTDMCARYGGEEFVICMPETDLSEAETALAKIQKALHSFDFPHGKPVTCSIGIAENNLQKTLEKLISDADKAMYRAKALGRDQIILFMPSK